MLYEKDHVLCLYDISSLSIIFTLLFIYLFLYHYFRFNFHIGTVLSVMHVIILDPPVFLLKYLVLGS